MDYIKPPIYLKQSSVFPHYSKAYQESVTTPMSFWDSIARTFLWEKTWSSVFDDERPEQGWFLDGKLNITINALDRHVVGARRNKVALFWSTENGREVTVTYDRLQKRVCQVANALKNLGVNKGDTVLIYMPNTVETIYAMLACARIGAIHVMLHTGLGSKYIRDYVQNVRPRCIFLADIMFSNGKSINLKQVLDKALCEVKYDCPKIVLRRQNPKSELRSKMEFDFHEFMNVEPKWINPEIMHSNDPLFMIFTSKPNAPMDGFVHTHGGYMVGAGYYTKIINDLKESDICWCTSDLSVIEGHTNSVYGTLLNGATVYFREGSLAFPNPDAVWRAVDKHGINILATSPEFLYELKALDTDAASRFDYSTLRLVSVLSDYINHDLYQWIKENLAGNNGAVIDTWFNAELGAPLIGTVLSLDKKPERTGKPYPGVQVQILNQHNQELSHNQQGYLSLSYPIPSMNQTICGIKKSHQQIPKGAIDIIAVKDQDGYITVKDRFKNSLFFGGHWISLDDIEDYLMHIPVLKEVKVWLCNYTEVHNKNICITAKIKRQLVDQNDLKLRLKECLRQEFGNCFSLVITDIRTSS